VAGRDLTSEVMIYGFMQTSFAVVRARRDNYETHEINYFWGGVVIHPLNYKIF
jgi:hypothetical protein